MRLLLCLLLASSASAQRADWDDYGRWLAGMRAAKIEVHAPETLDLGTLPPRSGLALLDARPVAHPDGLRRWVHEGGRLLLAVEGPENEALLSRFDLELREAPKRGALLGGHPALALLSTGGPSGLLRKVRHLVANRPVALSAPERLAPLVRFSEGTPFAYHLRLGAGEIVAIADTSVLINLMLEAGDNRRFAARLGAWLGDERAVYVITGGTLGGRFGGELDEPQGLVDELNRTLADLGTHAPPDDAAVHFFLALLLAAVLIYVLSVFPGGEAPTVRPPALDASARVERLAGRAGSPAAPPEDE